MVRHVGRPGWSPPAVRAPNKQKSPTSGAGDSPQSLYTKRARLHRPSAQSQDPLYALLLSAAVAGYCLRCTFDARGQVLVPADVASAVGWGLVAGAGLFLLLRSMPDLSSRELFRCELRMLQTTRTPLAVTWRTFTVRGVQWTVRCVSSQHVPGKPTFVLVHGHSSQSGTWVPFIMDTLASGANVHVLDMPGWGLVPAPPELTNARSPDDVIKLQAECIGGWLQAEGLSDIILAGHSVGAILAAHVAASMPDRVGHLFLLDACGVFPFLSHMWLWSLSMAFLTPHMIMTWGGRFAGALIHVVYNSVTTEDIRITDYYGQLYAGAHASGRADIAWSRLLAFTPFTCARRGWWKRPVLPLLLELRRRGMPMSILWAGADELFPLPFAHILQELLAPDVDLYVLEGCMHNPAHNNALGTARAMLDVAHKVAAQRRRRRGSPTSRPRTPSSPGALFQRETLEERPLLAAALSTAEPLVSLQHVADDEEAMAEAGAATAAAATAAAPSPASPTLSPLTASPDMDASSTDELGKARPCPDPAPVPAAFAESDTGEVAGPYHVGWCHGCQGPVIAHKSYWACQCGVWSFNFGPGVGTDTLPKLRTFLRTLHSEHLEFDAGGQHADITSHHPLDHSAPVQQHVQTVREKLGDAPAPTTAPPPDPTTKRHRSKPQGARASTKRAEDEEAEEDSALPDFGSGRLSVSDLLPWAGGHHDSSLRVVLTREQWHRPAQS